MTHLLKRFIYAPIVLLIVSLCIICFQVVVLSVPIEQTFLFSHFQSFLKTGSNMLQEFAIK